MAQRIVRAKRKIVGAGIPLRIPDEAEMPQRLDDVLTVAYLTYNEAHLTTSGEAANQRGSSSKLRSRHVTAKPSAGRRPTGCRS